MTGLSERQQWTVWLTEAMAAGARQDRACAVLGLSARTVQRWQADDIVRSDRRPARRQVPPSKLSESERITLLAVANSAEFGHLPPSQIVPRLADRGEYLASESTFYRVLKAVQPLFIIPTPPFNFLFWRIAADGSHAAPHPRLPDRNAS